MWQPKEPCWNWRFRGGTNTSQRSAPYPRAGPTTSSSPSSATGAQVGETRPKSPIHSRLFFGWWGGSRRRSRIRMPPAISRCRGARFRCVVHPEGRGLSSRTPLGGPLGFRPPTFSNVGSPFLSRLGETRQLRVLAVAPTFFVGRGRQLSCHPWRLSRLPQGSRRSHPL